MTQQHPSVTTCHKTGRGQQENIYHTIPTQILRTHHLIKTTRNIVQGYSKYKLIATLTTHFYSKNTAEIHHIPRTSQLISQIIDHIKKTHTYTHTITRYKPIMNNYSNKQQLVRHKSQQYIVHTLYKSVLTHADNTLAIILHPNDTNSHLAHTHILSHSSVNIARCLSLSSQTT